jgi:NADH-quinone oxidoreductase subunit N
MGLNYLASLSHYVPELVMCLTMIGVILVESSDEESGKGKFMQYATFYLGSLICLGTLFVELNSEPTAIFTNSMIIDPFSTLSKIIMVLGTMGAVYICGESKDIMNEHKPEFLIVAVGVLIGGMILSSANNMLMLFIGIETLSILSYILATLKKNNDLSSEAGLKYSLFGGVSSGLMLFGLSHIFGMTGTIQFAGMGPALQGLDATEVAVLLPSFLLFFAGLGYKIACVPFHMWAPDVYEGSPMPVTAFFSIVPKIAGIVAIVRVSHIFFSGDPTVVHHTWLVVLSLIGALTMTVGNVSAIGQRSVKRMLAYSSISHAGMMLMGVVVMNELGHKAILFYGVTYLFMTIVAFGVTSFVQDQYGNDHFERFSGLIYRYPVVAIIMALVMFSLAGIPPLSGFVAKFNILAALIAKQHYVLAVIAGLNSVVALYYYLKIIQLMVFKPVVANDEIEGYSFKNQFILAGLTFPVIFLGIFWDGLMTMAGNAKLFLLTGM